MDNFLRVIEPDSECLDYPTNPAYKFSFELDPFQKHAIAAISRDENVLITAKTGSGKTLVGEYQIAHSLAKGSRVFYTTPIKSLSNQKFHDLNVLYPGRVGILTGDLKFRPNADIVVMTTEILRNLLNKSGTATENVGLTAGMSLEGLDAVIFDEIHYINNKDRGKVWEETLILLPRDVNIVGLSATIAKPEELASWIGTLKQKPIHLISTTYRIVPLTHYVFDSTMKLLPILDANNRFQDSTYKKWLVSREKILDDHDAHKKAVKGREEGQVIGVDSGKVKVKTFTHQLNAAIQKLYTDDLLPALFFIFSRKDCEKYASLVESSLVDTSDAAAIGHIFDFHLSRYKAGLLNSPQYHMLRSLLVRGIAFHHSGLQPILKEIVEILFGKGLVKVMFCTETFAVGINMPTKTVVFLDYKKYSDAGQRRMLATDEYIQMAGRAGRRGKDTLGTVIYLPRSDVATLEEVRRMMTGGSAYISSQMNFGYEFLLRSRLHDTAGSSWKDVLRDSFWYKEQMAIKEQIYKEKADIEQALAKLSLTKDEVVLLNEYLDNKSSLKQMRSANLQREVTMWENTHMGPRWKKVMSEYPALSVKHFACIDELARYEDPSYEETLVRPYLNFLEEWDFIQRSTVPTSKLNDRIYSLTQKGLCATEVNEAHPLLLSTAYYNGWLMNLNPEDLVGFISMFAAKGGEGADESPPFESLHISEPLHTTLAHLNKTVMKFWESEKKFQIQNTDYWDLSTFWVEIGIAIMKGSGGKGQLCEDFGIYEGNLYKFVMSLHNMIDEMVAMATLCSDVNMLKKLTIVKNQLDSSECGSASWGESLYLRL